MSIAGSDPTWGAHTPSWFIGGRAASRSAHTDDGELDAESWYQASPRLQSYAELFVAQRGLPLISAQVVPTPMYLVAGSPTANRLRDDALANSDICDDDGFNDLSCASDAQHPLGPNAFHGCAVRDAWITDDATLHPGLRYAVSLSRAVDAVEPMLREHYGHQEELEQVWAAGCSKSGWPLRHLLAMDDRFDGVIASCLDHANFGPYADQVASLWGREQGFHGVWTSLNSTSNPVHLLDTIDPARWAPEVSERGMLVTALGTQDQHVPVGSTQAWAGALPDHHRVVVVPNAGHTAGTVDHITALVTLVDHRQLGTPWASVRARWDYTSDRVTAQVSSEVAQVGLWCATELGPVNVHATLQDTETCEVFFPAPSDSPDLRHARWEQIADMEQSAPGR